MAVTSVECDSSWVDLVQEMIPSNATIIYQANDTDGEYCRTILREPEDFDVVVIDGHDRNHCVTQSLHRLSDSGVLVLDDSDRPNYARSFSALSAAGFNHLRIAGLKPNSPCRHATTIFYRQANCFGI